MPPPASRPTVRNGSEALCSSVAPQGTHFITPSGHTVPTHHLRAFALRRVHSWLKKPCPSAPLQSHHTGKLNGLTDSSFALFRFSLQLESYLNFTTP